MRGQLAELNPAKLAMETYLSGQSSALLSLPVYQNQHPSLILHHSLPQCSQLWKENGHQAASEYPPNFVQTVPISFPSSLNPRNETHHIAKQSLLVDERTYGAVRLFIVS